MRETEVKSPGAKTGPKHAGGMVIIIPHTSWAKYGPTLALGNDIPILSSIEEYREIYLEKTQRGRDFKEALKNLQHYKAPITLTYPPLSAKGTHAALELMPHILRELGKAVYFADEKANPHPPAEKRETPITHHPPPKKPKVSLSPQRQGAFLVTKRFT